jgi:RNA-directed DNA polymerase
MKTHVNKTVPIEFSQVEAAYRKVRRGGKAAGIDHQSWTDFDKKLSDNLYVIWNRMASGSYHPQAVRQVEIPKKDGKVRKLGIPTLRDRIAQQVVKDYMEKKIDHLFHEHSYGYRPLKSAHDALDQVRRNCYEQDWVIDLDIAGFFDEIDHQVMLKAVEHVMDEKWVKMYVNRWLEMPVQLPNGKLRHKTGKGTPQGGVISPILANLYLHFTLDKWLSKHYPDVRFVRYADDVVIHCNTKEQAEHLLEAIRERLGQVKLQVKESKTHIAYCKDYKRKTSHENVSFEFLGFSYQPRPRISKRDGNTFMAFAAEISPSNQKRIRQVIRELGAWNNTRLEITDLSELLNSRLRGWINYYGKYSNRTLRRNLSTVDLRIIKWISKKHKLGYRRSYRKLKEIRQQNPMLFYHWQMKY